MARFSINLPNALAELVRQHDINVSALAREAVEQAVGAAPTCPHRHVQCVTCRVRLELPPGALDDG